MIYIVIPICFFVVFAAFIFWFSSILYKTVERRGKLFNLDVICAVLMSANVKDRMLICHPPDEDSRLRIEFGDDGVTIELRLAEGLEKNRRNEMRKALTLFDDVPLQGIVKDGDDVVCVKIQGTASDISKAASNLFVKIFKPDGRKSIFFKMQGYTADLEIIEDHWNKKDIEAAVAPSSQSSNKQLIGIKRSGVIMLAYVFLWPIPFIVTYYQFGLLTASSVYLAMYLISRMYHALTDFKAFKEKYLYAWSNVFLLSAGLTVYFDDTFYLQVSPAALCVFIGLRALFNLTFGRSFMAFKRSENQAQKFSRQEHRWLNLAILVVCILGVVVSEHVRLNQSLEAWVWYFSYFRLELLLGLVIAGMPIFIKAALRNQSAA